MSNIERMESQDEIDLVELIKTLWDKKLWIILSSFVCTALAGTYAFTAKEQWTSTAEVITPTSSDLGKYTNLQLRFAQITKNTSLTIDTVSKNIYARFDRLAFSQNERRDFFQQSDEYKRLTEGKDENAQRKVLASLAIEYTAIVRPDPKKNVDMFGNRIKFSAEKPEIAQKTLTQFIDFINQKAFDLDKQEFQFLVKQKVEQLSHEKQVLEESLKLQKEFTLNNQSNSLMATPIQQGIPANNTQQVGTGSMPDAAVMASVYGEQYLQLQIKTIETQLQQLQVLENELKEVKGQAYSYQASPDYPVNKDKPKKALILLIGLVIGGILGCLVVLIKHLFTKK